MTFKKRFSIFIDKPFDVLVNAINAFEPGAKIAERGKNGVYDITPYGRARVAYTVYLDYDNNIANIMNHHTKERLGKL